MMIGQTVTHGMTSVMAVLFSNMLPGDQVYIGLIHEGGIRSSVIARWTADQQADRSILRQGHDS